MKTKHYITDYSARELYRNAYLSWVSRFVGSFEKKKIIRPVLSKRISAKLLALAELD